MIINPYAFGSGVATVTWNPSDKNTLITLSGGNLIASCTNTAATWKTVRATHPDSGKRYFEAVINTTNSSSTIFFGVCPSSMVISGTTDAYTGKVAGSIGYLGITGQIYVNNSVLNTGPTFGVGDVIRVAYDPATSSIWLGKNGTWILSGDPGAGTNPVSTTITSTIYPAVSFYNGNNESATGRFKAADFTQTIPTGFSAWQT